MADTTVDSFDKIAKALQVIRNIQQRREERYQAQIIALKQEILMLREKLKQLEDSIDVVHTGSLRKNVLRVRPVSTSTLVPTHRETLRALPELDFSSKQLNALLKHTDSVRELTYARSSGIFTAGKQSVTLTDHSDKQKMLFFCRLQSSSIKLLE